MAYCACPALRPLWHHPEVDLDSPAGYVLIGAAVTVLVGLLVMAVASTRMASWLGLREDAPWWFTPAGGRTQGLVVAYVGALVSLGAMVDLLTVAAVGRTSPLAWALAWVVGLGLLALTGTRVARIVVQVATEDRSALEEPAPELFIEPDPALDDVDLAVARAATDRGEWRPAAELLAASVDHDARYGRITVLAIHGLRRSRWLDAWLTARPTDPNAQAVRATLAVRRAWELRGPDWEPRNVQAFLAALEEAEEISREAVDNDPTDPSPRAVLVEMARGQQVDTDELEARTRALYAIAPLHQGGREAELQYRCHKWFGSAEEMFACARAAAAEAPPGSALAMVLVTAHIEHYLSLAERSPAQADRYIADPATRAEVDAVVARWQAGPGGASPVNQAKAHNTLAFFYWLARDRVAARQHLARTAEFLDPWPWSLAGDPSHVHALAQQWAGAGR